MPDIFEQFNSTQAQQQKENNPNQTDITEDYNPVEELDNELALPDNVSGDPAQQEKAKKTQYANNRLGALEQENLEADPDSWSPEYTMKGFMEESGNSIMRGIGTHILKGTGDMLQVAGGLFDPTISDGTWLSRSLQDAGTQMEGQFKAALPEELQGQNITWGSMMNPKFWSLTISEMIPQLAEFIFLSKGGGALAKKGLGAALKGSKHAAKTALKKEVFGQGKGAIAKLATDRGLTQLGSGIAGAVGGGVTGNFFSGMLNAAEVVNSNKDLKDDNGNPLYTEEELGQMASGTMRKNANWMLADIASWGMTYGGGWKALRGLNPVAKGGKVFSAGQSAKISSNIFRYDIAPVAKSIGRLAGKAGTEGVEEMFQETYEEWAKMKAVAEVTGEEVKYDSYMDFYNSKENEATKVVSFALGALGGAAFNMRSLINQTADDTYKLHNRMANLKEIINKQGTDKELDWQSFYISQSIADVVIDEEANIDPKEVIQSFVDNGNINKEEQKDLEAMANDFVTMKEKGKRLNVKGLSSLMHNHASETYYTQKLQEFENIAKESIADIKSVDEISDTDKKAKINEIEQVFQKRMKSLSILIASAKQNKANLIIGKKAKVLKTELHLDKFGNEIVTGGLSTESAEAELLKKGETLQDSIDAIDDKKPFKMPSMGNLGQRGKEFVNSMMNSFTKAKDAVVDKVSNKTDDNAETEEDVYEVLQNEDETFSVTKNDKDIDGTHATEEEAKKAIFDLEKANAIKKKEAKENPPTEEEVKAKQQAKEKADIEPIIDENEIIEDEVFKAFQEKAEVSDELLNSISDKIHNTEKLSNREDEIRKSFLPQITENISKKILGIKDDIEGVIKKSLPPAPKIDADENAELNKDEKDFVESEVNEAEVQNTEDIQKIKDAKAKKDFNIDRSKITGSETIVLDKRIKEKSIKKRNIREYNAIRNFLDKVKDVQITEGTNISQSELDNYLNSHSSYNHHGPSDLHRMSVVNHQLKRMFPDTNDPAQAIIVRNLYESIGSEGLGSVIGSTIFIDTKTWEQDRVFMHEMSHILYRLSLGEDETQAILKSAMADKERVNEIKKTYNDYTLYNLLVDDEWKEVTKGQITNALLSEGFDKNGVNAQIQKEIRLGGIKSIPFSEQKYLKEELFVSMLEGPLSQKFDKVFNAKNEVKREADTKKWWGLLRKKGAIIQQEDGVDKMLRELSENDTAPEGNLKDYLFNTFKAVTKGVQLDSFGLDARPLKNDTERSERIEVIKKKKAEQRDNNIKDYMNLDSDNNIIDDYENEAENGGVAFSNKDFDSHVKATGRILRRFGTIYNKALRHKFLKDTEAKTVDRKKHKTFNKDLFESSVYGLAIENNNSNAFIDKVENSAVQEMQAFNRFLNKVHPKTKYQLLNSMHFVLSNSKHIGGFRNLLSDKGVHEFETSLSQREQTKIDVILADMKKSFDVKETEEQWKFFENSVSNIYTGKDTKEDYINVINMLTDHSFRLDKILEQGFITYKGNSIPIETLISGYIKNGLMFQNTTGSTQIYYGKARNLIEALVDTNRKFTPTFSVKNAEGNMEPIRITNNHLTKEIDNILSFLAPDQKGKKKTKEQFLKNFSHLTYIDPKKRRKNYVPNQFLENIYDQYERGVLPTISQYHGLEDINNNRGSLYKNSTALEQTIEDLLIFEQSSRAKDGRKLRNHLGNMGTFADSPRKFFMNMKTIHFGDMFTKNNGKLQFKADGRVLNGMFQLHNKIYNDKTTNNKVLFKKELINSMNRRIAFINNNGNELSEIQGMKKYFKADKRLNGLGRILIAEQVINSIADGYNITEVFLPGVKNKSIVKRMKMNSSPILSVKNTNFKVEPFFFADEIVNNSIAGTDSGMFVTKKTAEKLQALGKGVFDMKGGFKLLNASVEKNNINFRGKTAYLKGYTTIISKEHPLFNMLTAMEDKYDAYHEKKHGGKPSIDLSDGSFNHIAIAIPQSSDKSNFSPTMFINEDADGTLTHTPEGAKMTPEAISNNMEDAMKIQEKLYYSKAGIFKGIESYNFGPQQIMDKETKTSTTPVQMVNYIMTNASVNGKLELAHEIQQHIVNQKRQSLQKVVESLSTKEKRSLIKNYKAEIEKGLNKEDMDQVQRLMIDDNGSISHPYVNKIIVNQLTKTIRREGNKLMTDGTVAHQKPDLGFRMTEEGKISSHLKGYTDATGGGLNAAEIVLPRHMLGTGKKKIQARQELTIYNFAGKTAIRNQTIGLSKTELKKQTLLQDLNAVHFSALKTARKLHNISSDKEARKYIGEVKAKNGTVIGYYVKGETVIASRVPGHGPSSTGVFEVVGFDVSEGNQVMVGSEFNDIIGSDNDGDALFIQTKGNNKEYAEWNQAFSKMKEYWLSPEMKEQVQTKMIFKKELDQIQKTLKSEFKQDDKYSFPFSPEQRMKDYNNTLVSKRNIGPVFNLHKIANLLAAYEIKTGKPININKSFYKEFRDSAKGITSRNQQSAILANIILDNAKDGYADALGLDEYNIAQAVLLVNLGVPLIDVGRILNSPSAKLWSEKNRNNNSMFHKSKKQGTIINEIERDLKKYYKNSSFKLNENASLKIQTNNITDANQQSSIINLFKFLSEMNGDIQKISKIMSGHNEIHVNPFVLEKQLKDYSDTINNTLETKTLHITDEFKSNPDMKHYAEVADEALKHLKRINPVYRGSTNDLFIKLNKKIGEEMSNTSLEKISKMITKFDSSRLLGYNNVDIKYAQEMMSPTGPNSIYKKLEKYLAPLKNDVEEHDTDITKNVTKLHNSILFRQALNLNLSGNSPYIRANPAFKNDSINQIERERAQEEFQELPTDIKDDLILYDLIMRDWQGSQSISPFFDKDTNFFINMAADEDMQNKNDEISPVIMDKLAKIISLKMSLDSNNPFQKIYTKGDVNKKQTALNTIFERKNNKYVNPILISKIGLGQPIYINVRKNNKVSALYEIGEFTPEEFQQIDSERTPRLKTARVLEIAKEKLTLVPNTLTRVGNKMPGELDLALISDKNVRDPHKTYDDYVNRENLSPLVEATITFDEAMRNIKEQKLLTMDAREDFDIDLFTKEEALTLDEFSKAMEFKDRVSPAVKTDAYNKYLIEKKKANKEAESVLKTLDSKPVEELLSMYEKYGEKNVYAYSNILTPIVKKLASELASDQSALTKRAQDGKDISMIKAHMITGSTIPSNHPASQGLARMMEVEYKKFINEKKKYISEMNKVSDALYREKLNYGVETGFTSFGKIKNTFKRIGDMLAGKGRQDVYERLYGNLVERTEKLSKSGKLIYNFKFRPIAEINKGVSEGWISKAEKDFYDHFRKVTKELQPPNIKTKQEDYIPHTAMTNMEVFSNRGLLGLMVNSKPEDTAIYDVKLKVKNERGETVLANFKTIEDNFKREASYDGKNSISKILAYRKLKSKAKKLLKQNKNEDGSKIIYSAVETETALGFGAINRFANERSITAQELPSMDLNKALGDYIHSSLFVTGNDKFQGMRRLQGYIDGVLAHNRADNLPNMNQHVQKVWKDYFLRGQRQTSILGKKADKVVLGLTRMNLFYALGYQANKNTGGMYAIGNVLAGKYHNIKDIGGKAWVRGELLYWGLDKGFEGGITGVISRRKRMANIMKSMNFMEINIYDEVNIEKKNGLDAIFADLALAPMIYSEQWIQQVHMIGLLSDKQLNYFDDEGHYKNDWERIHPEELVRLEDQVKSSHGRGYQPTDQRAIQMYSWGNMMLQFSRFIPTMFHDRFAKADVNIYGKDTIGTLTAVKDMVQYVVNNPKDFVRYRNSLSPEARKKLDSGLKGMAMASIISIVGATTESDTANQLFFDTNYYWAHPNLSNKAVPAAIQTTRNLVNSVFN